MDLIIERIFQQEWYSFFFLSKSVLYIPVDWLMKNNLKEKKLISHTNFAIGMLGTMKFNFYTNLNEKFVSLN